MIDGGRLRLLVGWDLPRYLTSQVTIYDWITSLAHGLYRPFASCFVLAAEPQPWRAARRRRTPYLSPPSTPSPATSRHPYVEEQPAALGYSP
jgi:hypothetical protein